MGERGCHRLIRRRGAGRSALLVAVLVTATIAVAAPPAPAAVPAGFSDVVFISGLSNPTAIRFAPNGQIFPILSGTLIAPGFRLVT